MKWSFIDYTKEKYFLHYNLHELDVDEFYLTLVNHLKTNNTYLYTLNNECVECPYTKDTLLPYRNSDSLKPANITGHYSTILKFRIASDCSWKYLPQNETKSVICDIDSNFGQFGVYDVNINHTGCSVNTLKEPVNIYTPMVTVLLIYLCFYFLIGGIIFVWNKLNYKKPQERLEPIAKKVRIQSLDTFRGLAIALMIFANLGNGNYHFIRHARWNGLHVADLAFPSFVWIMGVCIPITLTSNFRKGLSDKTILRNAFKRSVKLFCLGMCLVNNGNDAKYLRIFGVLQRLSVSYLAVSTICLFCMKRPNQKDPKANIFGVCKNVLPSFNFKSLTFQKKIEDILVLAKGWVVVLFILMVHTIIIFCVAAPGCPKGYLGPGGLHKNGLYEKCVGGATGYLDDLILRKHKSTYSSIRIYTTELFEHAGILGSLPSILHVFIGVQAGVTFIVYQQHSQRLLRWMIWAVVCGLIGGVLCGFSKENGVIPVNWNLWSLSFVLVTSCFAFTLLSVCYLLVDVKKWWSGKPFLFPGMNSILVYAGHQITIQRFPFRFYLSGPALSRRTHFGALLIDTWGVTAWILVSYYLYTINCFFTF